MSIQVIGESDVQLAQDIAQLASMGYKQEFKRDFNPVELFSLAFGLLVYAVPNGGPVSMVWGWATSSFFLITVALAMAELGSSMPMSGGLYFWTYRFAPPRCRRFLSLIVGYTNLIAYISGVAGIEWGCAVQIMAAATLATNSESVPIVHQTYGLYCGLLFFHSIIASFATRVLARLTTSYWQLNTMLCLAIIIGLPSGASREVKNSASFALGHFENLYSWPNGLAFILSFLSPAWVISGFDSSVHISEEARNANIAVPWAIILSATLGSILGFGRGTDLEGILEDPIGQPMATVNTLRLPCNAFKILCNCLGKKGTLAIWSFIIVSQFMMGITILAVSSRLNFAFARDGALPFSRFLYRINAQTGTPVNCVWTSALVAGLLGLLSFAGPTAIGAIFTLGVVAQYVSDLIPIFARTFFAKEFKPGPFSLGIFSRPVACVAICWTLLMTVVLLFPATTHTSAGEMNYTVVVLGRVLVLPLRTTFFQCTVEDTGLLDRPQL